MNLRHWAILFLGGVLMLAAVGAGLFWGATQSPAFYREEMTAPPKPELRRERARTFEEKTVRLAEDVKSSQDWRQEFTQDQINAWLAEELNQKYAEHLPQQVSDPRVRMSDGAMDVAFRAEDPKRRMRTVVTLRVVPRLVRPNLMELEIMSIRAGLVPLPVEKMLAEATSRLRQAGWTIEREQRDGRELFEIDLSSVVPAGASLQSLKIAPGSVEFEGTGANRPEDVGP